MTPTSIRPEATISAADHHDHRHGDAGQAVDDRHHDLRQPRGAQVRLVRVLDQLA